MPVFCRAMAGLLMTLPAIAQPVASETITVRPARSAEPGGGRIQVLPGGGWTASSVPVITLLSYAYDLPSNPSPRLSGLPDWTVRDKYDIEANAPANAIPDGLPEREAKHRVQQMIRGLLAGRFRLEMRAENRTMPVYALTVAGGGAKLEKSHVTERECATQTGPESCHQFVGGLGHPLNANAIDMDDVAHYLSNWTDLPVLNRTGLGGLFTVHTEGWAPMRLPPPPPNGAAPAANPFAGLPTIFTVLGKLGLELKRQEDTLPIYTVQRIERPTAN